MAVAARRFAVPAISFLFGSGLQVSGVQAPALAALCWGIAVVWGIVALVTWEPVKDRLVPRLAAGRRQYERLPVEFHLPVRRRVRVDNARPPAQLGIFDFELAFKREGARMNRSLGKIGGSVVSVGNTMTKYTPRFKALEDAEPEVRVKVARDFAKKVSPHAEAMQREEPTLRESTANFAQNYLDRIRAYPSTVDLRPIRGTIADLLKSTLESRQSTAEYRKSLLGIRSQNLQQQINAVLDHLIELADAVIVSIDGFVVMSREALAEIDRRRPVSASANRAARRRAQRP